MTSWSGILRYLYVILLMEEILHHLGCVKPCKYWDKLHINWRRISFINSMDSYGIQTSQDILHLQLHLVTWLHLKSDRPVTGQQLSWSQGCGPQTSWYMLVWRNNSTFGCFIEQQKTTAVLPAGKKTSHLTIVVWCGGRKDSKRRVGLFEAKTPCRSQWLGDTVPNMFSPSWIAG